MPHRQKTQIAGDALKRNITNLGPLVLPLSEQLKFFFNIVCPPPYHPVQGASTHCRGLDT